MKTNFFYLFCILLAMQLSACSDDDEALSPITLEYEDSQITFDNESRSLRLQAFGAETSPLLIKGGDGSYKVTNHSNEIVQVNYDGKKITFLPKGVGTTSVIIEDNTNNNYILNIEVDYLKLSHKVIKSITIIQGDNMTVGDKKKLEEEVKATESAAALAGYTFIFTNKEQTSGDCMLDLKNGKTGSYKFERLETTQFDKGIMIPLDNDYFIPLKDITHLQVDSKADINANLYADLYISNSFTSLLPRMTPRPPLYRCIIMDWTHEYKEVFPTMEHVYLLHLVTTSH